MVIYETTKSIKLGLDNSNITYDEIKDKLIEEVKEVLELLPHLEYGDKEIHHKALGEVLDVGQVLLTLTNKVAHKSYPNGIEKAVDEHNFKLFAERGWEKGQAYKIEKVIDHHNTLVGMIRQSMAESGDR